MSAPTELLPEPLPTEPLDLVDRWLAYAWQQRQQPNANAMVLATVGADGHPSARVVLCKQIVPKPGYLVFYTNYLSRKGRQLTDNPRAAVVMHWDALHRQVRVEGPVVRGPAADSDAYFASRPWQSRLGAWASAQSEPVGSRKDLETALAKTAERFGAPPDGGTPKAGGTPLGGRTPLDKSASPAGGATTGAEADYLIPRPPHWGGYRLWADSVELWVEGDARIHDRARWTRTLKPRANANTDETLFDVGPWTVTRLQP